MAFHAKVVIQGEDRRVRLSQAKRWVDEQCAYAWVVKYVSIRRLSLAETVKARAEQARLQEPLPMAEIPGLRYVPALNDTFAVQERMLAAAAMRYAAAGVVL